MAQYADYYFEYDEQQRVTRESINGGAQVYSLSYTQSSFTNGYNSWLTKTVETLPDGTLNTVYCSYAGRIMLRTLKSGSDEWHHFYEYDSTCRIILAASPSAISGYDQTRVDLLNKVSGNYQYLRDSAGLITTYTRHTPTGWLTRLSVQEGELGTSIKVREWEYIEAGTSGSSSSSYSSGSGSQLTWAPSKQIDYPDAANQSTKIETTFSYTWYTGTYQVKQKTTTLPVISSLQNGSGTASTRKEYFDEFGNLT